MKSPFKSKLLWLLHVQVLLAISLAAPVFGQGTFQDLDFESVVLPLVSVGIPIYPYVYASNAMPGWTLYTGTNQTQVLYNELFLSTAAVEILGPGWTSGGIIDGSYTAVLQAGFGPGNDGPVSTSIAQTGLIPLNTKSMFVNEITPDAPVLVTIDGQNIPMFALSTTNISGVTSTIFGGDISAFAGQTDTLEFTSPDSPNEFNEVSLDDIEFSLTSIPEPGTEMLLLSGGALFAFNRWRRRK